MHGVAGCQSWALRYLAEDTATVDVISGGRFELGVGVGYKVEEFEGFAVPMAEVAVNVFKSHSPLRRRTTPFATVPG